MASRPPLDRNKTGIQMSPSGATRMEEGAGPAPPEGDSTERGDLEVRRDYADAAGALGSVPTPGTMAGIVKSGLEMMTGMRPQVLIDRLGQRLAFERSGVRLYDTLLIKCSTAEPALRPSDLARLELFREQEAQHFALLVEVLDTLGADPTAQTPGADVAGVEGLGRVQAMNDPRTSLVQSLQVMLDAELIDNVAWDMLIELARSTGHGTLADRLIVPAQQEAEHLLHVRALVSRLSLQDAGAIDSTDDLPMNRFG